MMKIIPTVILGIRQLTETPESKTVSKRSWMGPGRRLDKQG